VELHDTTSLLVKSLFGEDAENFLQCSATKLMLYNIKVLKKNQKKIKIKIKILIAQNHFVTQYYEYRLSMSSTFFFYSTNKYLLLPVEPLQQEFFLFIFMIHQTYSLVNRRAY
jgi:hypothetical protein